MQLEFFTSSIQRSLNTVSKRQTTTHLPAIQQSLLSDPKEFDGHLVVTVSFRVKVSFWDGLRLRWRVLCARTSTAELTLKLEFTWQQKMLCGINGVTKVCTRHDGNPRGSGQIFSDRTALFICMKYFCGSWARQFIFPLFSGWAMAKTTWPHRTGSAVFSGHSENDKTPLPNP